MAMAINTHPQIKRSIYPFLGNNHYLLRLFIPIFSIWLLIVGLALAGDTESKSKESKRIIIGSYTLVSVTPASRKNYDFAYRAKATNKGKIALSSLVVSLESEHKESFGAIDTEWSIGSIAVGATATSTDTFTP